MSTKPGILSHPSTISWRGFEFSATRAAGKITGMKELIKSLTKKAGDEILDKKLEEKLDKGG